MSSRPDSILRIPSRQVLAPITLRALAFLEAVGGNPRAQATMAALGYTRGDHEEGWRLLRAAAAFRDFADDPFADEPSRAAIAEIVEWVRTNFEPLRAAIERVHGERDSVFVEIESRKPARAIVVLAMLLERVNALPDESPVRETLNRRGLDAAKREHLASLLLRAQRGAETRARQLVQDTREEDRIALYRWHADWALTARSRIRRKDVLNALGLRRRGKSGPSSDSETHDPTSDPAEEWRPKLQRRGARRIS